MDCNGSLLVPHGHEDLQNRETHRVVTQCVVQGVAWQDGGVSVDLVQSYHQAGDSTRTLVSSTERLHESEVEQRGSIRHVLGIRVKLEHLSVVQHFSLWWLCQARSQHQQHQQHTVHHEDQTINLNISLENYLGSSNCAHPSIMFSLWKRKQCFFFSFLSFFS